MAPALVEHSSAKERNSVSNKYLKFSCMSHLDIDLDLVEKFRHSTVDSPTGLFIPNLNNKTLKDKINSKEVMLSNDTNKKSAANDGIKRVQTKNGITSKYYDCINPNIKIVQKENGHADSMLSTDISTSCPFTSSVIPTCSSSISTVCTFSSVISTHESREAQPIAKSTLSKNTSKKLGKKHLSVHEKLYNLNYSISKINLRLQNLQKSNLSSHVASLITSKDQILKDSCIKIENDSKNVILKDDKDCGKDVSTKTITENILTNSSICNPLKTLYDLTTNNEVTDDDELESKVRIPLRGKRQKSEHPPPPPEVLHEWKQKRAKVGSQCSWLMLKITKLDEKISSMHEIHTKMKSERQARLNETFTNQRNVLDLDEPKNQTTPMESDSSDNASSSHVCSRTRPFSNKQHHKYIKQQDTKISFLPAPYNCRCLHGYHSCRLCAKNVVPLKDFSKNFAEMCDKSYHPVLSNKNDMSLSFLLEETLRKQKINTKVTITKSTKKKKKKNLSTSSSRNVSPVTNKQPEKSTKQTAKSKNERSKSDEYSRKRYAASDISSKLKKFRKFSESYSCDSGSKPSTPTNELASPLSLSTGSLSNLKRKKAASTVDYDINNIVIPYSMASSTRVERIQYKEIPTPGWRSVDDNLDQDGAQLDNELTDDESFSERHLRCEVLEKKRFTDYFQPARRQRSTRTSEGPNSEPPSPAYTEDLKSLVNTPVDSPISAIAARLMNISVCLEEEREVPWTLRRFPLGEGEVKKLEVTSEPPSPCERLISKPSVLSRSPSLSHISSSSPKSSPLPSPLVSPITPDVNWTVKVLSSEDTACPISPVVSTAEKQRKGIVLKLAKK